MYKNESIQLPITAIVGCYKSMIFDITPYALSWTP